jgi:hypothetical protein
MTLPCIRINYGMGVPDVKSSSADDAMNVR